MSSSCRAQPPRLFSGVSVYPGEGYRTPLGDVLLMIGVAHCARLECSPLIRAIPGRPSRRTFTGGADSFYSDGESEEQHSSSGDG